MGILPIYPLFLELMEFSGALMQVELLFSLRARVFVSNKVFITGFTGKKEKEKFLSVR